MEGAQQTQSVMRRVRGKVEEILSDALVPKDPAGPRSGRIEKVYERDCCRPGRGEEEG